MKGKKKLLALFASVLLIAATVTLLVLTTSATTEAPAFSIDYCNLSFSDSVYIKYAVASNVEGASLLIWNEPQTEYVKGTENAVLGSVGTEEISGENYMIFDYTELAAKQMTDVVYARVWIQKDGVDYYSAPHKYSILQYVYNKNGKLGVGTSDENLKNLLDSMLSYGADAQIYFGYKTDRLATSDFYQVKLTAGALSDGFNHGLYPAGDKVRLTAPATDGNGATFSGWQDASGAKVSTEASFELTVLGKNEVYTPVYVKTSSGLEIDEEGYVLGMGDCADTDVVIPAKSAEGVTVIGIDGSAFAGEPITSITIPATVVEIGRKAFNGCTALTDVYYDGTEEEWNENVDVSSGNDPLLNATFHFVTPPAKTYTVTFKDHDGAVLKTETVEEGKNATAPANPTRDGYTFTGWDKAFTNVTSDLVVTAVYSQNSSEQYTVSFVDYDGTVISTETVNSGATAKLPADPSKEGTTFLGWSGNYVNVTKDETVTAVYSDTKNVFLVESASGSVGDTVTVLVSVDGSVKVGGFQLDLFYDSALELISYDCDLDLDIVANDTLHTNGLYLNFSSTTDKTKQRDIVELTFKIKDTARSSLPVWLEMKEVREIVGGGVANASYAVVNGVVTVQ